MPGLGLAPATVFGNRTALRAGAVPALTLDFSALDPRLTFSRASTATCVDSSGLIVPAANDVPRFDHDPIALAPLGLLIEEQRTNLESFSENILAGLTLATASGMQPVGSGSRVDQVASPNGGITADLIAEYSNTGKHYAFGVAASAAATQTYSVFCKQGARTRGRIQIGAGSMGNGVYADADFAAGTISPYATVGSGYSAVGEPKIAPCANGFYRVSVSAQAGAAAHVGYVGLLNASGNPLYPGDGASGVYLWGWQVENGAFRTSYIPTNGGAATRAADMCFTTHVDFTTWLALAQKTVVITADSPANGTRRVFHMALTGDPANNYVSILTSGTSAKATVVRGGVTQAELPLGTIAPGVPFTVALAMAENNIAASLNGAPAVSDTSANMPACDKLWFGSGPAGEQLCGHLAGTWRFLNRLGDVEALSA